MNNKTKEYASGSLIMLIGISSVLLAIINLTYSLNYFNKVIMLLSIVYGLILAFYGAEIIYNARN